ncbi:hypothetical protein BDW22DRAFT_1357004, partial [Trametopsis cervina]
PSWRTAKQVHSPSRSGWDSLSVRSRPVVANLREDQYTPSLALQKSVRVRTKWVWLIACARRYELVLSLISREFSRILLIHFHARLSFFARLLGPFAGIGIPATLHFAPLLPLLQPGY